MEKERRRWLRSRARQSHSWVVTAGPRLLSALDYSKGGHSPWKPQREVRWPWGEAWGWGHPSGGVTSHLRGKISVMDQYLALGAALWFVFMLCKCVPCWIQPLRMPGGCSSASFTFSKICFQPTLCPHCIALQLSLTVHFFQADLIFFSAFSTYF